MCRILLGALLLIAARTAAAEQPHATGIYAEVGGKGGLWGVGLDHRVARAINLGAVGSGFSQAGQRYVTLTPYVGVYLVKHGSSALFTDVGAQIVYVWSQSPVPEWQGDSSAGIGGSLSAGYEYRSRLLLRIFMQGVAGKGGVLPWAGASVGFTF